MVLRALTLARFVAQEYARLAGHKAIQDYLLSCGWS